jgi:hypothetical protein
MVLQNKTTLPLCLLVRAEVASANRVVDSPFCFGCIFFVKKTQQLFFVKTTLRFPKKIKLGFLDSGNLLKLPKGRRGGRI